MSWEKYAYTSAGAAMLSESISGGALTITRAVSGTGTVDTDLSEETAVSGDTYELKLLGIDTVEYEGEKARKVSIWTGGADKPYFMHQIGVFGRLNDDPEDTLLFLMQDDRGIEIPAIGTADHEFQIAVLLAVSTKANISLTVDPQVEAIMRMVREMVLKEISQHNDAPDAHAKIITEATSKALKELEESGQIMSEDRVKELIKESGGGGGGSSGGTAADISYDNSKSGISAANVQEAIDALSVLTLTIQAVPAQSGSLTYTGSTQSPTWKGYDSSMMTIGGVTSGINAGTYTATFTPIGKYVWTDGTQEAKSVSWTIGRAEVKNVPAQTGSVTYNGSAQSPSWSNYNSSQLTIGGTSSATNAGSYSATFTPTSNYKWSDGTTTAKSASWTIGKATGSITLSASSLSLTYPKTSGTITVTRPGSGTVTASSGSTNIATVSVSGTTITVTAKATGSATITVNVGADTNYTAPSSKTFTVAVTLVSKTLSSNSWAVIKAVSDAGQGANYWSVGATKSVTINGKVGATTISSLKVDAFIIGFNHNSGKEGSNRIHFLLGKISDKFVGLVDSSYGSTTSTSGAFTMNTSNTNSGGWGSSQMRSKVLGSASSPTSPTANTLLAALPADLRAVMKSCTKYTDNKGGGNTASNVSSTTDYLFLLSEYEVFATHQYCNDAEPNYQAQYDYFKAGNSKVANKHSATGTAAVWWLRSPGYGGHTSFCAVLSSGSLDYYNAYIAYGVVPGFVV
ncbi:DUF6273 domain-containing protein [Faecalibacterium sp. CLA-AA-H254]|uniref:DUF6273 domain-containing protein n=1 Tax=Faecalibacterium hominis (ex Afrizal et al. 2022) TaxID=2881265 RepID=UPI001D0EBB5D|nr:DUF6273 domain-containing protein [Faecalibacterium hominis (ex Afrizal et al. 2022)]MCC2123798.1 DUF6273 domain-containing protein [Faecalibacterium hominis (ex Afrizal et al. 2022)]